MAIGTAAAIGLGVAGVGSVLGAKSQSKAASKAADTSLAVAQQNNALARENRDMLLRRVDPFINPGIQANALLNDFYGISTPQPAQQPTPNALAQFQGPNPDTSAFNGRFARPFNLSEGGAIDQYYNPNMSMAPQGTMYAQNALGAPTMNTTAVPQGAVTAPANSGDAFRRFIENSDYAFQFGEGANQVNSGYAGAGTLQSGAAIKDIERFRQNLQAGYRGEWATGVGNQQSAGLNALGAAAGVSTNAVNQITANNNSAGSAAANAALIKGQNNPFANALGSIGGGILGRLG